MATFQALKDPNALLDYAIDWSPWLATTTDTISTSTWSVPSALSIFTSNFGTASTVVWLSGGTAGEVYEVINHITTVNGRADDRTIEFTCIDR